jgi:plasmid replication initiation protein
MEHPLFSLSSKKDMETVTYVNGDKWLKVVPQGELGRATIHDRAVLLYIISQCIAAQNDGKAIDRANRRIRVNAYDMLVATNRSTSGRGYKLLENAFSRLQGTQIQTNITQGGGEKIEWFSLVDKISMLRGSENDRTSDGKMFDVEVTLSDWLFDAIEQNYVLTMHRDYFRLRKPIERRLYEIARKHCGKQKKWQIGLLLLAKKAGTKSKLREFKRMIQKVISDGVIPEYDFVLTGDLLTVRPKKTVVGNSISLPQILPDTYEEARHYAAGWDIRALEAEWRDWVSRKKIKVRNPDANFVKFCKNRGPYKQEELF